MTKAPKFKKKKKQLTNKENNLPFPFLSRFLFSALFVAAYMTQC